MNRIAKVLCGVAVVGLVGAPVYAAEKEDPIAKAVKARKGEMQVRAFNMGILAAMAKGNRDYDGELAASAAKNLHLITMMKNPEMWPKGSGNDNKALETEALPTIWEADSQVGDKAKAFVKAVDELQDVAGNGLDQMKPKFAAVGKACKGCHEDYREKKQ